MNEKTPLEIERKFLIAYPPTEILSALPKARIKRMTQVYLLSDPQITRRIRMVEENGVWTYYKTEKRRISAVTCVEEENAIEKEEYRSLLQEADPKRNPIEKTRFVIPFEGHNMEIDLYPFWTDRAILEVELSSEDEAFSVLPCLRIFKEVTADKRYKNACLAKKIVFEDLPKV